MKLFNGKEVIAKPYQDEDAEDIVSLIIRNYYSGRVLSKKGI